jgi:hypothetical protein
MLAPSIDRLVQLSDVGQFAAKAAIAANSVASYQFPALRTALVCLGAQQVSELI